MRNTDNNTFNNSSITPEAVIEAIEVTDSERLANGYTSKQVIAILIDRHGNTIEAAPVNIRGNEVVIVKYSPHFNSRYIASSMLDCIKRLQRMTRGQAIIVTNNIQWNESTIDLSSYLTEIVY